MCIGVDTNNLCPFSYNQIMEIMNNKQIIVVDHHESETVKNCWDCNLKKECEKILIDTGKLHDDCPLNLNK